MENDPQIRAVVEHIVRYGTLYGLGVAFLFIMVLVRMLSAQQQQLRSLHAAIEDLKNLVPPAPGDTRPLEADADEVNTDSETAGGEKIEDGDNADDSSTEEGARKGEKSKAESVTIADGEAVGSGTVEGQALVGVIEPGSIPVGLSPAGETEPALAAKEAAPEPTIKATAAAVSAEVARNRLASAKTVLDNLESEESTLELNRKLAYLQAEISALQGGDVLDQPASDLDQMLQFQNRLKDFIGTKHAEGKVADNPSAFAAEEVRRLEKVVDEISKYINEQLGIGKSVSGRPSAPASREYPTAEAQDDGMSSEIGRLEKVMEGIDGFIDEQMRIGREILGDETPELTRDDLEQLKARADRSFEGLVERQHKLADGFLNRDLTLVDGQIDVAPDLIGFCKHRYPSSPLMHPERPAMCQFANGEGPLHGQVVIHLDTVRQNCKTLMEQHDQQEQLIKDAEDLANEGKFEQAEQLLKGVNPVFKDLKSDKVHEQIDSWRRKLSDLEEQYARLKADLETPWERPFAQPWKVMARERRLLARARNFEDRLEAFRVDVNASENTEFVEEGSRLYHRLANRLNDLATNFTGQSTDAKVSTFLHFALIMECIGGMVFADREAWPIIFWTVGLLGCAFGVQLIHRALLNRTTVSFDLESNGKAIDDFDIAFIFLNKQRCKSGDRIMPGTYQLTLDSKIFEPVAQRVQVRYGRTTNLGTIPVRLCRDTYINSLEMKFVPVSGTTVMFAVWATRVKDFRAYIRDRKLNWKKPRFKQDDLHPAVNVSWEDARAFCQWLTERERKGQRIGHRDEYRLPTDLEWSAAVELGSEKGNTPAERSGKIEGRFPFGDKWPPSRNCANLDPSLKADPYDFTCKVGKFPPNRLGLFDLSGNVWEWCDDQFDKKGKNRVLRGGSWHTPSEEMCLSSFRLSDSPGHRLDIIGFRCVLQVRKPSPLFRPQLNPAAAD